MPLKRADVTLLPQAFADFSSLNTVLSLLLSAMCVQRETCCYAALDKG